MSKEEFKSKCQKAADDWTKWYNRRKENFADNPIIINYYNNVAKSGLQRDLEEILKEYNGK